MYNSVLYRNSPVFLQNILISLKALIRNKLRVNKTTNAILSEIEAHDKNSEKLEMFSEKILGKVLLSARENVEFYKKVSSVALSDFPYINKHDVLSSPKSFLDNKNRQIKIKGQTSGTTGAPLTVYQSLESIIRERAFANRQRRWAGFKEGDRRAWIRGDVIVPIEQKQAPFWRYSYFEGMILLSSFHMASNVLPQYIQAMVDYNVDVIQAYPSSIVTLAKYLESKNAYYPATLKSILTSSESLSKDDKKLVEKRFRCTVFDWYGLFERVAAIGSCEHGRYHILTDYSHIELLAAGEVNGKARAEVVGTNFNNTLYPLIRYKTGDHVILSDEENCPCGRVYPIVDSIEGRSVDFVLTFDGTPIYALDQCSKGVQGILGCQYVQNNKRSIGVRVVSSPLFTEKEKNKLIKNIRSRLGDSMLVEIMITDNLLRSKSGKVRQAICTIEDE